MRIKKFLFEFFAAIVYLFFVNSAVAHEIWTLEHNHLSRGDGMKMWNKALIWYSIEKLISHFMDVHLAVTIVVNNLLLRLWSLIIFEFQNTNKCNLLIEFESINILVIKFY